MTNARRRKDRKEAARGRAAAIDRHKPGTLATRPSRAYLNAFYQATLDRLLAVPKEQLASAVRAEVRAAVNTLTSRNQPEPAAE